MSLSLSTLAVVALLAAVGCGLMAGLFFAFSNFVMRALSRLSPGSAVAAMNSINREIANPLFLLLFFSTPVACLFLVGYAFVYPQVPTRALLLAGGAIYLVGALLVTVVCNIPRNKALAHVDPASAAAESAWSSFFRVWVRWNHVRSIASLLAAICFIGAFAGLSAAER